jgi:cysteine dioxygenase
MKVLQGSLREEIFEEPPSPSDERSELLVKSDRIYEPNSVTYICDNLGIHRITNPNDEPAISLHCKSTPGAKMNKSFFLTISVYTPPNAADFGFNIFDRTGKASYVQSAGADFTHVPCA